MKKKNILIPIIIFVMITLCGCITYTSGTFHSIPYTLAATVSGSGSNKKVVIGGTLICTDVDGKADILRLLYDYYPNDKKEIKNFPKC